MAETSTGELPPIPEWNRDSDIELAPIKQLGEQDVRELANSYGVALRLFLFEPNTTKLDLLDRVRGYRVSPDGRSRNEGTFLTLRDVLLKLGQEKVVDEIDKRAGEDAKDPSIKHKLDEISRIGMLRDINEFASSVVPNPPSPPK